MRRAIISAIAPEHLIVAPGHAVWNLRGDPLSDAAWHLRPYQQGEPPLYLEHIRRAVEIAQSDPDALVIFSGGQTARDAGPISEALGYWMLAEHFAWWGYAGVRTRGTTEEFALDSFQNVLFSLCRFHESTGAFPRRITVVGWGFKAQRFTGLHRAAVRFPADRFQYAGVNDPADLATARREEALNRAAYAADPYGATGALAEKRRRRNPFHRQHGYGITCPELRALLDHGGPDGFTGPLPWD